MRYFVALARELSYTRAAAALYISQSTLSQQILNLEQELGCELFDRNGRQGRHSVSLTAQGRQLLPIATRMVREAEQLPQALAGAHPLSEEGTTIQVGLDLRILSDGRLRRALSNRIFHIRKDMPGLQCDFRTGEFDALRSELRYGRLDIGFFLHQEPNIGSSDGIACSVMGTDELAIAVRSEEPIEDTQEMARKLLTERSVCLLNREGRGLYQAMKVFERLGVEPEIHLSKTRESMTMQVYSGQRIAVLPEGWTKAQSEPDVRAVHFGVHEAKLFRLVAWRKDASVEAERLAQSFVPDAAIG